MDFYGLGNLNLFFYSFNLSKISSDFSTFEKKILEKMEQETCTNIKVIALGKDIKIIWSIIDSIYKKNIYYLYLFRNELIFSERINFFSKRINLINKNNG